MDLEVVVLGPGDGASEVVEAIGLSTARLVAVRRRDVDVGSEVLAALAEAIDAPMAATASPVPGPAAAHSVSLVERHVALPPPPTLDKPCHDVCVLSRDALTSVDLGLPVGDWPSWLVRAAARLVAAGWRHVAAPGTSWNWDSGLDEVVGPANEGLATHRLWCEVRQRAPHIGVDGACLSDDPHNGSQAVVWNMAVGLKAVRPEASVVVAAPAAHVSHFARLGAPHGVSVVPRDRSAGDFDVVYRPYQPLDPSELSWIWSSGRRVITSQLDMIAFSNPTYHPSPALFHMVRNLQRRAMRLADGVTFISEFGRQAALAECPDLDPTRTFVVSCGADPTPPVVLERPESLPADLGDRFLLCASATFWHKNRQHGIRVFDALCRRHDYAGQLVIAGPEPYYGRSTLHDDRVLGSLDPSVRRRVLSVGRVDEPSKWWLLGASDLVLYPSVVEGFGLVPFEAASVGTPTLVFRGSAFAEVLGSTNAVVTSWDVEDWAARASGLIASAEASRALVDELVGVASQHTWTAVAERVWTAVDEVLARPRTGRFADDGGPGSRVAPSPVTLALGARTNHLAHRVRSYAERRWRR